MKKQEKEDSLTFLVFRGGNLPRSFKVSRNWFFRAAALFSAAIFLAVLGWASYGVSTWKKKNPPERSQQLELEKQLADLRSENESLKNKIPADPSPESNPAETPIQVAASLPGTLPVLFSAKTTIVTPGTEVPVRLESCKRDWTGPAGTLKLHIRCNLVYTGNAGGEQTGRLLVIARGNTILAVHPDGALSPSSAATWIPPERGESYKVGRFRQVTAEFGPFSARESIREVSVWIFDALGKLILKAEVP